MGKLLILLKYVISVFSVDINEKRKHVHVVSKKKGKVRTAKFWLEPSIEVDEKKKGDFNKTEINEIIRLIEVNKEVIKSQLDKFYQGKTIKAIRKYERKTSKTKPGQNRNKTER